MIKDPDGVQFLKWYLPRLHLRWQGFRKVRRQVYKRIIRRLQELRLPNIGAYREYLEHHADEWAILDTLSWISISRFYRDRGIFQELEREILPQLAELVISGAQYTLRCWSAGCSGGEEPYTLAMLWQSRLAEHSPALDFQIVATDIDPRAIQRAERGCYAASSLKELPPKWRDQAFTMERGEFCIKRECRVAVTFAVQDIRAGAPAGVFHLILCRNFVFTYFDEESQRATLERLKARLVSGGALIIGKLESLPEGVSGLEPWSRGSAAYRKL